MPKLFSIYVDYGINGFFQAFDDSWNKYEFDCYKDAASCVEKLQKETPYKYIIKTNSRVDVKSIDNIISKLMKDNAKNNYEHICSEAYTGGYQDALIDVLNAFKIDNDYDKE